MNLIRVTQPLYEPCSVDEMKLHMRVDGDVEHGYIQSLIIAARKHVEDVLSRTLMGSEWELHLDRWPGSKAELPMASPLRSISSVTWLNTSDAPTVISSSSYYAETGREPGRIVLRNGASWPGNANLREVSGVRIRYLAGYADALTTSSTAQIAAARNAVPETFRAAIKLIVGHLYENREAVVVGAGLTGAQIPLGVDALLWPDRVMTF